MTPYKAAHNRLQYSTIRGSMYSYKSNNPFIPFMFISKQSSSFVDYVITDLLRGTVSVYLKNPTGIQRYAFKNVSRRAIANLMTQPNMSLGFWVNSNCFNSLRAVTAF